MDIGQGLTDAWNAVVNFAPAVVAFLLILVLGWLIAWFVGRMVGKGLASVGLDRALDRGGVGEYFQRTRWSASELCGKIVYYIGLLFVLTLAFNVFGPNPVSQLLNNVIAWIPNALVALIIVVVAGMIAKAVRNLVSGALGDLSYGRFLANAAAVFILALGVIAALNQVGVALTVTLPVLVAVLATVGGILIVGVGGGLIKPMQARWSEWLDTAERETGRMREEPSYQAGRSDAMGRRTPQEPQRQEEEPSRSAASSASQRPASRRRDEPPPL